jgi:hypothetical protein
VSVDLLSFIEKPNLPHTVTSPRDDQWERQHVDAGQWPAACGYDPAIEPITLFAQLTGVEAVRTDEIGAALEAGLRTLAAHRSGREINASPTFIHPRYEWCTAALNGLCADGGGFLVETAFIDDGAFDAPPVIESWGEREHDVPVRALVRATGAMTVVRAWQMMHAAQSPLMTHIQIGALVGAQFRLYRVEWDEDLARRLFDRVARFWAGVKVGDPPPKRDTEAFYAYVERRYPSHEPKRWVEADDALMASIAGWSRIDADIQELKRQRHAAKNEICARIKDAEGVRGVDANGVPWRLPWRSVRGPRTLNKTLLDTTLRHLLGDDETNRIIEMCTKQGEGYRKLGPKWEPKAKTTQEAARTAALVDEVGGRDD